MDKLLISMRPLPPANFLNCILRYDEKTGLLWWKSRQSNWFKNDAEAKRWNSRYANTQAFACFYNGYKTGTLNKQNFFAHRIAWKLFYHTDPLFIDHINGSRSDNRIENLRSVTRLENNRNTKLPADNESGVIGVCFNKNTNKWVSQISSDDGREWIGSYASKDLAVSARKSAEIKLGYHPNHGRAA